MVIVRSLDDTRLCQHDRHGIVRTKRFAARRTLARTVADEILHADVAEDMAAKLERRVSKIRVADGTDGDSL